MKIWEILIVMVAVGGILGGFLWPYTINTWLDWAGKESAIGFLSGFGVGCIPGFGLGCIPLAVITWIADFFVT